MSVPSMRIRLSKGPLPVIICALGVAAQIYILAFLRISRVEARGSNEVLLTAFDDRRSIAQTFAAASGVLQEMRFRVQSSVRSDITIDWVLAEEVQGAMMPIRGNRLRVSGVTGEGEVRIQFPPVVASDAKTYRLDLKLVDLEALD